MGFRITISKCGTEATVHFRGALNFDQAYALFQHCQLEEFNFKRYRINLSQVRELTEAGLSALRKFVRWGEGRGIEMSVVNASAVHRELCRQWGIPVYPAVSHSVAAGSRLHTESGSVGTRIQAQSLSTPRVSEYAAPAQVPDPLPSLWI